MQDQGSVPTPKGIFASASTCFGVQVEVRFGNAPEPVAQAGTALVSRPNSLPMDNV